MEVHDPLNLRQDAFWVIGFPRSKWPRKIVPSIEFRTGPSPPAESSVIGKGGGTNV